MPLSESSQYEMASEDAHPNRPSQSIERRPSVSLSRPQTTAPTRRRSDDALVIEPMHDAPQPSWSRCACEKGMVAAKPETSVKTPSEPKSTPRLNLASRAEALSCAASWTLLITASKYALSFSCTRAVQHGFARLGGV